MLQGHAIFVVGLDSFALCAVSIFALLIRVLTGRELWKRERKFRIRSR
jgi:hypothetical protein